MMVIALKATKKTVCLSRCYHLEGLRGINHRAGVHTESNILFTYGYKKSTCDKVGVSALKSDSITNVRNICEFPSECWKISNAAVETPHDCSHDSCD